MRCDITSTNRVEIALKSSLVYTSDVKLSSKRDENHYGNRDQNCIKTRMCKRVLRLIYLVRFLYRIFFNLMDMICSQESSGHVSAFADE